MYFVWDKVKGELNKRKHGISFELTKRVFEDPCLVSWMDNRFDDYQEERWVTLGCIDGLMIIVVIHTFRSNDDGEETIRIISARKATKKEREAYDKQR